MTGRRHPVTVDGSPVPQWEPVDRARRRRARRRRAARRGPAHLRRCCAAGSTCRCTSARRRPSRWAASAGTPAARSSSATPSCPGSRSARRPVAVPEDVRPQLVHEWEVAVQEGPQPAPSYFTPADMEMFYDATWQVQTHANRTGIRLDRAEAAVGAARRRRGRAAPVEPARQPVLGRRAQRLRRHPDPARSRRPEPRRVRLPADRRRRPPLEDGPDPPRRHGPAGPGARRDRGRAAHRRRPARVRAPRPGRAHRSRRRRRRARPGRRRTPDVVYLRGGDDNVLVEYGADGARPRPAHARARAGRGAEGHRGASSTSRPGVRSLHVHVDPSVHLGARAGRRPRRARGVAARHRGPGGARADASTCRCRSTTP